MSRPAATGYKSHRFPDQTQISIRIEDELFEDIRLRAERDNVSVTEEIRMLLEWGIDAASREAA